MEAQMPRTAEMSGLVLVLRRRGPCLEAKIAFFKFVNFCRRFDGMIEIRQVVDGSEKTSWGPGEKGDDKLTLVRKE